MAKSGMAHGEMGTHIKRMLINMNGYKMGGVTCLLRPFLFGIHPWTMHTHDTK